MTRAERRAATLERSGQQSVVISSVTLGPPAAGAGARATSYTALLTARGSLQQQRSIKRFGEATVAAGMALEPPAYKLYLAYAPLPRVPLSELRIQVDGVTYPLLRSPIDVDGGHTNLELHLGEPTQGGP